MENWVIVVSVVLGLILFFLLILIAYLLTRENPSVTLCETSDDCLVESDLCIDGICVPRCYTKLNCPFGNLCDENGICVPGCENTFDCESDKICVEGQCVIGNQCKLNSDCETGLICLDGDCVTFFPEGQKINLRMIYQNSRLPVSFCGSDAGNECHLCRPGNSIFPVNPDWINRPVVTFTVNNVKTEYGNGIKLIQNDDPNNHLFNNNNIFYIEVVNAASRIIKLRFGNNYLSTYWSHRNSNPRTCDEFMLTYDVSSPNNIIYSIAV